MIRQPPNADPYFVEMAAILNAELDGLEPKLLGWRHDGTTLHLRFRTSIAVPWVQVHVQSTEPGEGGSEYDAANYTSSVEVDCRADRVQDVSVPDLPVGRYWIYLVPVQYDGAGAKVLYDGVAAGDAMAFKDIGV